ncbi:MAG: PQQ-dependent dehydrogenase, methanol/ethanol family [Phenylobacterium sp.]|jgi:PQQ-dependent dehydrogenase (methanol/ethanol family)|uniref:PQQ-dependent dehydrogenase, methanol/ethanol family n=1 Tax=Phenylobacterium sp. TaxID=1871053 RepID=UPI002A365D2B|nr:PQQ-dependent dehydrogenase, methanol/ethanol family [Phenylobacterium sp.]MDX9998911.1 PQQ-dependent dehydrogenase, methanol/ethanol family [Phenylobacterium sp.]
MRAARFVLVIAALMLTAACQRGGEEAASAGRVDQARLEAAESNAEWLSYGRSYSEQRYSPLTQVNSENVGQLGLAWYAEFDTDRGQEATPLVVDGVLYTTTAWSKVSAFDARSGQLKWSYDPKVPGQKGMDACCDVVNRGVAVWNGKVFVGALDGRLIALDAATGKPVWSVQTTDTSKPYTITGAPRVIKGKVLIGNGGGEYGVRGYLSAYDADSGQLVWRFYTTPNPQGLPDNAASDKVMAEKAAATWFGEGWKESGGGATVWDAMAYDPALDILYVGVGNGSPWNHQVRSDGKGDNLFVSSILALKPDTGAYVWHYQTTPGETWDYTATQHIILADLQIGGQLRKVLMQAPKNGFFYVLDRATGELISANNYVPVTWATSVDPRTGRPIENPAARYRNAPALQMPAPFGGHNWHPMAFNPKHGLVYIPAQQVPFAYTDASVGFTYRPGAWNTGVDFLANALPTDEAVLAATKAMVKGQLIAWDPVAQKARWTVEHPYFWNAGVLTTAGDLVFQGAAQGEFAAYHAGAGQKLWSYKTTNGVIAAPMTYELDGEQYVAIMVGYGGAGALSSPALLPDRPRLPGRLLVFKLGGTASAPEYELPERATLDLTTVSSTGDARRGFELFHVNCQVCHGPNASGAFLPDLKASQMLLSPESFRSVLIDGALASRGMPSFKAWLTADDAEALRAYIISEAKGPPATAVPAPKGGPAPKT